MKVFFGIFALFVFATPVLSKPAKNGVSFCYWGSWANRRPGIGSFGVSDLPTDVCTHIVYSFLDLTATGELIVAEESDVDGKSNTFEDFAALKEKNSDLKLIVAIGGWSAGSLNFSAVANDDKLRAKFIKNLVHFIYDKGLDGLDFDWEYPAQRGGNETDKEAFVVLCREVKKAFEPHGWLLTAAVGVTQSNIDLSYNVTALSEVLDYINLMAYDLHGTWDGVTGANAPLHPQLTDPPGSTLNVADLVQTWITNGADPAKLVLGVGAYGRSFNLTSLDNVGTGAPITGPGAAGPNTGEGGTLAYYEICLSQSSGQEWNVTQVADSYVYGNSGSLWVGYDNNNTMYAKGKYAADNGLAGIMVWALDLDDFAGVCSKTTYPLIKSAIKGYNRRG